MPEDHPDSLVQWGQNLAQGCGSLFDGSIFATLGAKFVFKAVSAFVGGAQRARKVVDGLLLVWRGEYR
jgi:hypothetical protein